MELLVLGFAEIMAFSILLNILIGVVVGIVAGSIPGFTITMAIALTLPVTFAFPPTQGLAIMVGVYVGGFAGGLMSATLLGIPGTPSSVATTFDAYPMAQNGEPGRALGIGTWSSFFGSIIGTIVLMFGSPFIAELGLLIGPWEYAAIIIFGLTVVASLVSDNVIKGLISTFLGLIIAVIGADPIMGAPRLTFGYPPLTAGLSFLITLIGMYAVSQLIGEIEKRSNKKDIDEKDVESLYSGVKLKIPHLEIIKDIFSQKINLIRSSLIGVFIGALPGAGGSISNILAYDQSRKFSKNPKEYGTGISNGIVASEAGNSGTAGGGLIPMIALGIPGSEITAIMLGALIVHGINPGPLLISNYPEVVGSVFAAFWVASLFMLIIQFVGLKAFLKVIQVPMNYLIPLILVLCVVGAFSMNNRLFDVQILLFFGVLGYIFKKINIPLAPFVLANVLGIMLETNVRRALMTDGNWHLFFTRPISLGFILLAIFMIVYSTIQEKKLKLKDS